MLELAEYYTSGDTPCVRCGAEGYSEWSVCALGKKNLHVLCRACDVGLNEVAVRYVFGDKKDDALDLYRTVMQS